MDLIRMIDTRQSKTKRPEFSPGDTIKVHVKIKEGDKERIQVFQGTVIARGGRGAHQSFTVRKISSGIGVERVFPLYSPSVAKIELVKGGDVRRAKLYYLRKLKGKSARIEEKLKELEAASGPQTVAIEDLERSRKAEAE